MNKLLNKMNKMHSNRPRGAPPAAQNTYEPSIRRALLGIAGVAMTVITIAVSVVLPAQMASGSREPRVLVASAETPAASEGLVMGASITVVAPRVRNSLQ